VSGCDESIIAGISDGESAIQNFNGGELLSLVAWVSCCREWLSGSLRGYLSNDVSKSVVLKCDQIKS
jgi:hypothetical protein